MPTVSVNLKPRYNVVVESGAVSRLGAELRRALPNATRVAVISDARVNALYGAAASKSLHGAKLEHDFFLIGRGERTKNMRTVEVLLERFVAAGLDRKSAVVALGGGVVGDVAGFAASIYMRGIAAVQAPTTLLAQVDAAIGGKTGVNLRAGKNLVGTFHQPKLVLCDSDALQTLSERQFRSGLFEVIKCGIIRDAMLAQLMATCRDDVLAREPQVLTALTQAAVKVKAAVVAADEKEAGLRRILNFGHTIGHALEAAGGYRQLLHGEAVAWGMIAAAAMAQQMRVCSAQIAQQVRQLVEAYGPLPTPTASAAELLKYIASDKKSERGSATFVLPVKIGQTVIRSGVTEAQIRAALSAIGVR